MSQRLLFTVVAPIAARLPEPVLVVLAVIAGIAAYLCAAQPRRAVDRNLRVVLPHLDARGRRRVALATFIHGALGYVELFKLPTYDAERLQRAYPACGWEHFDAALQRGRGVIIVSAHVGSPSVAGQLFALRGVPAAVVVEPLRPPELFARVAALRSRFGARLIPADHRAIREIVTALRANQVVGILCDRNVTGSGEILPFFGKPTRLSTAPAALALRTGAAVVPAVAYRTRPFQGAVRIFPAIEVVRHGDPGADVRDGMAQILRRIESMIRAAPSQWVMFTDVWPSPLDDPRPEYNGPGHESRSRPLSRSDR